MEKDFCALIFDHLSDLYEVYSEYLEVIENIKDEMNDDLQLLKGEGFTISEIARKVRKIIDEG